MHKCKCFTITILVLGVLFLLQDLAVWSFWNISWYTAIFILVGLHTFCKCDDNCFPTDVKKKK